MAIGKANSPDDVDSPVYIEGMNETEMEDGDEIPEYEISELYNFDYNCVYNHIEHDEEAKSQYKYDLSQIISESRDGNYYRLDHGSFYSLKLLGIFTFLNHREDTKHIFNLLRKKMPTEFHDETSSYHNIRLVYQMLSYDFLHLYHPCICDIYHDHDIVIKTENLNKLLTFLDNIYLP